MPCMARSTFLGNYASCTIYSVTLQNKKPNFSFKEKKTFKTLLLIENTPKLHMTTSCHWAVVHVRKGAFTTHMLPMLESKQAHDIPKRQTLKL